jgi:branched-chain amino acid transport system permease protein
VLENMLVYGLVNSVQIILIGLGFSLAFGLSGVPNFAHGALYLMSGYVTWLLLHNVGVPYALAVPLTVVLVGLLGALIYRVVLLPVRGILLSEVIATFALGVAILEFFRWMGFVTYEFNLRPFVRGSVEIAGVFIDYQRLIIVGIGLALAGVLWAFTRYTRSGLALRAVAQDEDTAVCLGIESDWTAMLSIALGSALAAVAAVAILPLGIISIGTGYEALLIALAVTVLGGVESTAGLVVGGLLLGYSMVFTSTYVGPQWTMVVYLAAIVAVLAVKPSGIFGKFQELEERV